MYTSKKVLRNLYFRYIININCTDYNNHVTKNKIFLTEKKLLTIKSVVRPFSEIYMHFHCFMNRMKANFCWVFDNSHVTFNNLVTCNIFAREMSMTLMCQWLKQQTSPITLSYRNPTLGFLSIILLINGKLAYQYIFRTLVINNPIRCLTERRW